MAGSSPAGGPV